MRLYRLLSQWFSFFSIRVLHVSASIYSHYKREINAKKNVFRHQFLWWNVECWHFWVRFAMYVAFCHQLNVAKSFKNSFRDLKQLIRVYSVFAVCFHVFWINSLKQFAVTQLFLVVAWCTLHVAHTSMCICKLLCKKTSKVLSFSPFFFSLSHSPSIFFQFFFSLSLSFISPK